MGNFFPVSSRHTKAREFLELKQGTMTVLEYVAKLTELVCFGDGQGDKVRGWFEVVHPG